MVSPVKNRLTKDVDIVKLLLGKIFFKTNLFWGLI